MKLKGLSEGIPDKAFSKKQLQMGIKVELEHTISEVGKDELRR
jgi:hypothetical protein